MIRPPESWTKRDWRVWAAAARDALPREAPGYLDAIAPLLDALPPGSVVLGYRAFRSEPSLEALPETHPHLAWAVTRTRRDGTLSLHPWESAAAHGPMGFLEPPPDAPVLTPASIALALVPGLAFDPSGTRLGYGKGCFDRLLPQLPAASPTVGITRAALVVPELPREPWDVPVKWLLTDDGLRRLS
ncbi:MAG TPA: 5-formyltetrahydrofolate cyclo-ligase [Deinococcales bacterium]|nr:5-formyltetrahydrofolate cyclo-ligase [Deinococcales bacterium]